MNIKNAITYWSKPRKVEAVRLTEENMREVADSIGAELCVRPNETFINHDGDAGYAGEWLVRTAEGAYLFYSDEDFLQNFWTHDERMTSDERYARVFVQVSSAMTKQDMATYHGDPTGMDLVAIEATKKIMGEF